MRSLGLQVLAALLLRALYPRLIPLNLHPLLSISYTRHLGGCASISVLLPIPPWTTTKIGSMTLSSLKESSQRRSTRSTSSVFHDTSSNAQISVKDKAQSYAPPCLRSDSLDPQRQGMKESVLFAEWHNSVGDIPTDIIWAVRG